MTSKGRMRAFTRTGWFELATCPVCGQRVAHNRFGKPHLQHTYGKRHKKALERLRLEQDFGWSVPKTGLRQE